MKIEISNKHLFYCVHAIWERLDFKFRFQVYTKVKADSEDETIQSIEIDKDTFVKIMKSVNSQEQGVGKDINKEIYDSIYAQVVQLVQSGDTDAIEIAQEMDEILLANADMLENKILNGKTQILS